MTRCRRSPPGSSSIPERIFKAVRPESEVQIQVLYGDVTARSFMQSLEFSELRRAVVSPEDTLLTAGGGVANTLLRKADPQVILDELQKFAPIPHKSVAVTSAGRLPVHYIFHTAALQIESNGTYSASANSIAQSVQALLDKADALEIGALWIPLIAAGIGGVEPNASLRAILEVLGDWKPSRPRSTIFLIFVYRDAQLDRRTAKETLESVLKGWQIT
jgi:O-acetyl-ADP-ribose deacetylase (regulator of RNase III)